MIRTGLQAIVLRQDDGNGGAGTPPPQLKFDIEEVKASGLFVPKEEFEKTITNYKKQIESTKTQGYNKLGEVLDSVANEITSLTGIERAEIEKEGKKEREKIEDYLKRVITAKQAEPLEKEKQLRDMFSKKEQNYASEISQMKQEVTNLRYSNEMQGALSKVLTTFGEENFEKNQEVVTAILATKYSNREYSTEYNRFVYYNIDKNNNKVVIENKNGEPKTTQDILAEVAEMYLPKNNAAQPRGLGVANNQNSKPNTFTTSDIHNELTKQGLKTGSREYQEAYSKMIREMKK